MVNGTIAKVDPEQVAEATRGAENKSAQVISSGGCVAAKRGVRLMLC